MPVEDPGVGLAADLPSRLVPRLDWNDDVRPVLVAVKQAADESDDIHRRIDSRAIEAALGREEGDLGTFAALQGLSDAGYVEGQAAFGNPPTWHLLNLTEKGRQEVSGWPVLTIVRGKVVMENGKVANDALGHSQFVSRPV